MREIKDGGKSKRDERSRDAIMIQKYETLRDSISYLN